MELPKVKRLTKKYDDKYVKMMLLEAELPTGEMKPYHFATHRDLKNVEDMNQPHIDSVAMYVLSPDY